jgi:hypothetical protein
MGEGRGDGRRRARAAHNPGDRGNREGRAGETEAPEEEGDELICGLICNFRERQRPYCKGLATFKPMLKWRWSKKQKCMVFQTLQLLFKVHLHLSNSFRDKMNLVKISCFM